MIGKYISTDGIVDKQKVQRPMAELWALLEHDNHFLHEYSGELLSETVELTQQLPKGQASVHAVILKAPDTALPDLAPLALSGVQQLIVLEHPQLAHYSTLSYVDALAWLLQQRSPMLTVASATPNGRDCLPRLAARLHMPFVPNALGLTLRNDALLATRAIYDGRAYVQTQTMLHSRSPLATLISGVRGVPSRIQQVGKPFVTRYTPQIVENDTMARVRRVAIQAPSPEEVELDAAERIVAGGRGIGQQGFQELTTFAHQLRAAVGATRVATDQGWIEHARQIGATGKIVRPKLYIACGISGAAQHTSGMSESKTVIAINPDRSAPIFSLADLGLLGDANEILPLAAKLLSASASPLQFNDETHTIEREASSHVS